MSSTIPRLKSYGGFTLIEITMVVLIVGVLAGLAIPGYWGYLDKARIARCIAEVRYIEKSVKAFYFSSDAYPTTLAEAGAGQMVDPWGYPYEYLNLTTLGNNGAGAGGGNGGGGGGGGNGGGGAWLFFGPENAYAAADVSRGYQDKGKPRRDRFLRPVSSDFDLFSIGKDGESKDDMNHRRSADDVVRAADGAFVGLAAQF